jgi:hypothetical protein
MKKLLNGFLELHLVVESDLLSTNLSGSVYEECHGKQVTYAVAFHNLSVSKHDG